MNRSTFLAGALTLACALSAPFVLAQDAPPPQSAHASTLPMAGDHAMKRQMHRRDNGHSARGHRMDHWRMHGPGSAAASDLRALEKLYRDAGRSQQLAGIYNDVLGKTQDPMLRTYVYHQLAQLQAKPANVEQAAATLRKSLNENLANEAKRRTEREAMRQQWLQRRAAGPSSNK